MKKDLVKSYFMTTAWLLQQNKVGSLAKKIIKKTDSIMIKEVLDN